MLQSIFYRAYQNLDGSLLLTDDVYHCIQFKTIVSMISVLWHIFVVDLHVKVIIFSCNRILADSQLFPSFLTLFPIFCLENALNPKL